MNIMILFYFFSFLAAAFIFWKKIKEEHFDDYRIFDYFLSSLIMAWLLARLGFIILNFSQFGFSLVNYVDIFAKPGFSLFLLVFFWGILLYRFAKKNTNNSFAVLDFWATAVSGAAVWIFLGWLISGTHFGNETTLPIGLQFPGVFNKYHPTQAYSAIFYLCLLIYLSKLEYAYRSFSWYRGSKGSAQTGFLFGVFVIASALWWVAMTFLKSGEIIFNGITLDIFLGLGMLILGTVLLIARSGKFQKSAKAAAHDKKPEKPLF